MVLKRVMGKASFATLQDQTGRIQLYISDDGITKEKHQESSTGIWATSFGASERSSDQDRRTDVQAASLRLLAKALQPLPEKFHASRTRR